MKIFLSLFLVLVGFAADAQTSTNCGVVDWVNNLYNTNMYRLRIVNYTNGQTLKLPYPGIVLYQEAETIDWDGCFTEIKTNGVPSGSAVEYYSSRRSISGCKLAYARLNFYWDRWKMDIYTVSKYGWEEPSEV